jgi:hypothetical protein
MALSEPDADPRRVGLAVWSALVALFVATLLVIAYEAAMHFAGVAIDGPFQLYDALRRIQAGYRPGVDFEFFHGLGIPVLHYGLYRLFGGGLRGSELARQFIAAVAYPAVFLIFFRVFTKSWRRALCLTAAALAASFALKLSAVVFALNGMLGVRSALPALVPVILYLAPSRRARIIATGVALGVALVLSTEQGLAVTVAYAAVAAVAVIRGDDRRQRLVEALFTLALAVATLVCCLLAIGGYAGMRGALQYNFQIVPIDQFWFFGAPPNVFVPSWSAGLRMAIGARPIGEALLLGCIAAVWYLVRLWRTPAGEAGQRNFALALLPVYGLISCGSLLGVFTPAYAQPCWRTLLMVGGLELATLAARSDVRASRAGWLGVPRAMAAASLLMLVWTLATIPLIITALVVSLPHIAADHVAGDVTFSMGGIWPETLRDGQRVLDAHRTPTGALPTLWSTYAGWLEARNGIFNPSFDYIIHALGPENRRRYVDTFRSTRPTLVQTVHPAYTQYEQWLENNDWPFYDELLKWYTVTATTPWSIFWERRTAPGPTARFVAAMQVPAGMRAVQLPPIPDSLTTATTLLLVDVDYDTRDPLHWLPIIGASPRYIIGLEGAVSQTAISLDPSVRHTRFPLLIKAGQRPTLHFETFSLLPGASWTPRALAISVLPVDAANQPWLTALVPHAAAPPE